MVKARSGTVLVTVKTLMRLKTGPGAGVDLSENDETSANDG